MRRDVHTMQYIAMHMPCSGVTHLWTCFKLYHCQQWLVALWRCWWLPLWPCLVCWLWTGPLNWLAWVSEQDCFLLSLILCKFTPLLIDIAPFPCVWVYLIFEWCIPMSHQYIPVSIFHVHLHFCFSGLALLITSDLKQTETHTHG